MVCQINIYNCTCITLNKTLWIFFRDTASSAELLLTEISSVQRIYRQLEGGVEKNSQIHQALLNSLRGDRRQCKSKLVLSNLLKKNRNMQDLGGKEQLKAGGCYGHYFVTTNNNFYW